MELERLMKSLDNRRARDARQKARYRAKYRDKIAAMNKRYREENRAQIAEAKKQYRETHREQYQEYRRRYREKNQEKIREATKRYRANHRRQYRAKERKKDKDKQRTVEKVKALGPLKLTVTLTDHLKSPCVDTPVVSYLDTFCQSLEADYRAQPSVETCWNDFVDSLEPPPVDPSVETYIESFCQLLDDSWTLTNLDSGGIQAAEPPLWPDDFMDTLDVCDLLEDMSPEDWAQVLEDVMDPFDLDAFVT